MFRKHWSPAILGMAIMVVIATASSLFMRQGANATALAQAAPTPVPAYYNFGVKFVCGYQPGQTASGAVYVGEPPVKPGNYATEINIHNFNYRQPTAGTNTPGVVGIRKKVLLLVEKGQVIGREPKQVAPRAFDTINLYNDGATMDDCNRIWQLLYGAVAPPTPMPLMIGYLVLISRLDLDVDAVYTAEVPGIGQQQPTGISQDVVRVQGKRVAIPDNLFPKGGLLVP